MAEKNQNQATGDTATGKSDQVFRIQRMYLKDVSFESPLTPTLFASNTQWKPEVALHLNTDKTALDNDLFEVVLTLTVTVKSGEETAYLTELKQAGLFTIKGFDESTLNGMLYSYCPNILFPFAREAVASLVLKGGFPQLLLEPVNFDALYAQHVESARQNAPAPGTPQ
ncbi:MAG: protein-export chaperone SecB [Granulosicoccus sp.]|nr:protein-export chaperone SecB [Granulosicoccus sp.]